MDHALIDTDVLLKSSSYKLLSALLESKPFGSVMFAMLGAAKYVVLGRLKKKLSGQDLLDAKEHFSASAKGIVEIEPTQEEIRLAARLEALAVESDVDLDSGESQLCAVLISRSHSLLMTGDKRAIVAIGKLCGDEECALVLGKVASLEQTILWLVRSVGLESILNPVCSLKQVDSTLTMCFGCYSGGASLDTCIEGLASYINDLKVNAPGVLIAYPDSQASF